ncbi:MAG: mechanosensitive ion channel domain-containing protein [Verrucomicrobiota bacterium]|nr:mechanosensitive ion channel domain-containing protein [Verrucomicrobiota bacterium]
MDTFPDYMPLIVTLAIAATGSSFANWALKKRSRWVGKQQNFVRPLVMLGLLGLVPTGIIGLSSTSFVSNAMAGLMLRSVGSFRSGDYIEVQGNFGRVSARRLFHTEIQAGNRVLNTMPNLFLVSNPVKVVRSSGTIVSATVLLGYDTSQSRLEALLKEAAKRAGLGEPFVQVVDLDDLSVNYRVAGFLEEVKGLVTARSNLRVEILNTLHNADIEIMSPSVMMQRPTPSGERLMPRWEISSRIDAGNDEVLPEEIIFDKADEAEKVEMREKELAELKERRDALKKEMDEAEEDSKALIQPKIGEFEDEMDRIKSSLASE